MNLVIQESDVETKVDLLASLHTCEAAPNGECNDFNMYWELNHLSQYNDRKMYLVLQNSSLRTRINATTTNNFVCILAAEGIELRRPVVGSQLRNMLLSFQYVGATEVANYKYDPNRVPTGIWELSAIPSNIVNFKLYKSQPDANNVRPLALMSTTLQLFLELDLQFSLVIMKQKR